MQTSELPLFPIENKATYIPNTVQSKEIIYPRNDPNSLEKALNSIFPSIEEISKSDKARGALGSLSREFSDEQLNNIVSDFEYLASYYLDIFERKVFDGKTLGELLVPT